MLAEKLFAFGAVVGFLFILIAEIIYVNDHDGISNKIEEIIVCAFWLPGFILTNLIKGEYRMSIAEFYYSPLRRYFAKKFSKRLVIVLLSSNQEIHYHKGHRMKSPKIEELESYDREILCECGLLKSNAVNV